MTETPEPTQTPALTDRLELEADVADEAGTTWLADLLREAAVTIHQGADARRRFLEQAVCHPGPPLSEHEGYTDKEDLSELEAMVLERMDRELRLENGLGTIWRLTEEAMGGTLGLGRNTSADPLAAVRRLLDELAGIVNSAVSTRYQAHAHHEIALPLVERVRREVGRGLASPDLNPERRGWRATGFTRSELKRRRAVLQRRLGHLEQRVGERIDERPYDAAEVSALKTSLVLFDEALGLVHSAAAAQAMSPVAVDNGQRDAVAEHIRAAGGAPENATVAQIVDALNATSEGVTFTPNEAGDGVNWEIDQKAIASTIEIVGGDRVADLGLAGFDGFIARHKGALNSPETRRRIAEGLAGLLASAEKPSPKVVCVSTEAELLRGEARFEVRGMAAPNPEGTSYEEACEDWARSLASEFSCDFVTARQVVHIVGAERARDVLTEAYATNVHPVTVANRVAAKP